MTGHDLSNTVSLLARTPAALDALLRDLADAWVGRNEGDDTWSVVGIIAHLIHGERTDWMPRARMVLHHGEAQTFEPSTAGATCERVRGNRWHSCWTSSLGYGRRTWPSCAP